jgi:hypothetical protein
VSRLRKESARFMKLYGSKRRRMAILVVVPLLVSAGAAMAICEPGTCYVQDLRIRECRSVREALPDLQRTLKISPAALEVLLSSDWSIVRASATNSRAVRCSQTDTTVPSDPNGLHAAAKAVASLLADAPCSELKVGTTVRRFRRTPCCEGEPLGTPECILPGDILEHLPKWLGDRGSP